MSTNQNNARKKQGYVSGYLTKTIRVRLVEKFSFFSKHTFLSLVRIRGIFHPKYFRSLGFAVRSLKRLDQSSNRKHNIFYFGLMCNVDLTII